MKTSVWLFVPNIIGYARFLLLVAAFSVAAPSSCIALYILQALLDGGFPMHLVLASARLCNLQGKAMRG